MTLPVKHTEEKKIQTYFLLNPELSSPNPYTRSNKNSLVSGSNNKNEGKINSYTFMANNLKQMFENKSEMSK